MRPRRGAASRENSTNAPTANTIVGPVGSFSTELLTTAPMMPEIAPKIARNWSVNWPKVNAYIDALVAVANLVGLFARAVK